MTDSWPVRKYYANTEITFCYEGSIIWSKHKSECFYNTQKVLIRATKATQGHVVSPLCCVVLCPHCAN